ncbi:MAG TPA: VOC family protein [Pyrinomonadaceae bacterium]|nr:VOC family protein [Pyrinomonadaceae bacterium]
MRRAAWLGLALGLLVACARALSPAAAGAQGHGEKPSLRTSALKINVDDMEKALSFYTGKLGFEVADRAEHPRRVVLKTDDRVKLILCKVGRLQKAGPSDTQVGLTLQVNDLDEAIRRMKAAGVEFAESERRKEGVGYAISVRDPFGRRISLMHQTVVKVEPFREPRLYNFGFLVPDMEAARDFYSNRLGFVVRSEKYLPLDLPLGHADKTFGFMLHYRPGVRPIKSEYPRAEPFYTVVFEAEDLRQSLAALKGLGVENITRKPSEGGRAGAVVFEDPFGNVSEIVQADK